MRLGVEKVESVDCIFRFWKDDLRVGKAGRLGLSRGKERKILLSSAAIWLIYSDLRFQSPNK